MRVEEPKSPVRSGSRLLVGGRWRRGVAWRLREAIPRNPAKIKMISAQSLDCFSLEIKKIDIQIRNQDIIF